MRFGNVTDPRDLPFCDKCKKPVDRLLRDDDLATDEIVFTVFCHGAIEETRIPRAFLLGFDRIPRMSAGVAFKQTKQLDKPSRVLGDGGTHE